MPRIVKAPTGNKLSCKNWITEAAMRMLMNNLDPDVAEKPEDLIVYGGSGKAARNWECFDKIVESLKNLNEDETLLVQSGKPVAIFKTHINLLSCILLILHIFENKYNIYILSIILVIIK